MISSGFRLSLALVVTAGLAIPATAQDPNAVIAGPERLARRPEVAAARTLAFWTTQRLQTARSLDVVLSPAQTRLRAPGELRTLAAGEPLMATSGAAGARPGQVVGQANVTRLLGEAKTLAGIEPLLGTSPFTFSRYRLFPEPPRDPDLMYRIFPYALTGKLFFVIPEQGTFVCSASSINSENLSVVWTAGHCVATPTERGVPIFHTNFLFVPGYHGQPNCGATPFGCWTQKTSFTLVGWGIEGKFEYDHGALVMNLGGNGLPRKVGQRIGFLGFIANIPYDQHWHDHGYPQAAPFDGVHHEICTAQLALTDLPTGIPFVDPETMGIGCDQTGGTSGGPWVINFSGLPGPTNLLNGNNSYRYLGGPPNNLRLFGPYFTTGAINLRDAAQGVPVP